MNSGSEVVINTPRNVRIMAERMKQAGVLPEIESFDSGDCHLARDLLSEGVLQGPGLFSLVLGVKYGFSATPETMFYARSLLPPGAIWSGFGIGRSEFPMVAQAFCSAAICGSAWRTISLCRRACSPGLNAELVSHAATILKSLGAEIASSREARAMLRL